MSTSKSFPMAARSVREARRFVTDELPPGEAIDDIVLLVSEIATNIIRHAQSAFTVVIDTEPDGFVRVALADENRTDSRIAARSPGPSEPTGRGLQIVDALADDWGFDPNAHSGHTVWFRIRLGRTSRPGHEAEGASRVVEAT